MEEWHNADFGTCLHAFQPGQAFNCAPLQSGWFDHTPGQLTVVHYSLFAPLQETSLREKVILSQGCVEIFLLACRECFSVWRECVVFHTEWVGICPFGKHWLCTRQCFFSKPKDWILLSRHDYWLCLGNIWLDEATSMCFLPHSTFI